MTELLYIVLIAFDNPMTSEQYYEKGNREPNTYNRKDFFHSITP